MGQLCFLAFRCKNLTIPLFCPNGIALLFGLQVSIFWSSAASSRESANRQTSRILASNSSGWCWIKTIFMMPKRNLTNIPFWNRFCREEPLLPGSGICGPTFFFTCSSQIRLVFSNIPGRFSFWPREVWAFFFTFAFALCSFFVKEIWEWDSIWLGSGLRKMVG